MPYVGNSEAKTVAYALERELLTAGLSYAEIAEKTGERQMTISERNRLVHQIDIWDAFSRRCEREGVPRRVPEDRAFCSWFTGFFDADGSIVVYTRRCTGRPQYGEFRLGVRTQIQEDDAAVVDYLCRMIGCGNISSQTGRGTTQASVVWRCEKINDLREVIIPLFDDFPLRTKKSREYALFRPLVVRRYIDTLGGRSSRNGVKEDYVRTFKDAIHQIDQMRNGRTEHPVRLAR